MIAIGIIHPSALPMAGMVRAATKLGLAVDEIELHRHGAGGSACQDHALAALGPIFSTQGLLIYRRPGVTDCGARFASLARFLSGAGLIFTDLPRSARHEEQAPTGGRPQGTAHTTASAA